MKELEKAKELYNKGVIAYIDEKGDIVEKKTPKQNGERK